ncbi:MAG TPA: hypothetical protein VLA75_07445, partial [Thermoanaerobaculia bacterium]|nr:hypothetical protein [Thermoanaerobaculia bacterium]
VEADAAGNAYVAGYVGLQNAGNGRLVMYDGAVDPVWSVDLDAGGDDRFFSLRFDGGTGLYVAGFAGGGTSSQDCLVAKYSTAGAEQWVRTWGGAAGGGDLCWDVALGPAGRIYAVGAVNEGGEDNLLALGLGPTGAVDWWHSSDPSGSDSNRGAVVDPATGDLIALGYTGRRTIQPANWEGFRLGRFQADGTAVWEVPDPVTTWGGVDLVGAAQDRLGRRALATDAGGNLLVTGQAANGTTADLFVAKLDRAGRTLWAQLLDTGSNESGRAVAVDAAGNVYVLGFGSIGTAPGSENSGRLIVAKYDPQGGEVWRHISTAFDRPRGLAVDGLGNVYAVARVRILRLDPDGAQVYSVSTSAVGPVNDFVLDAAGSLYLVGGSSNLRASKYDALGVQQWFREVDLGGTEVAWAAVLDPTGNLAAVGEGPGAGGRDMLVSRFDPLGNPLENLLYSGCGGDEAGYAVVPGDAGSLFLGGDAVIGGVRYLCLLKVTPGTPGQLAQVLYGVATEERRLLALAYDPAGRLVALGRRTASGNEDWSTTVWNASLGFVQELVEDVSPEDRPVGLALGAAGDLFVGGSVFDPIAREQARVVKYGLPGLVATPASGLLTSETGATATFDVSLNVPPASGVTVPVATSDASEGLLSETSLVFTPGDWNQPQSVTATGQDDALPDGSVAWVANLGPATSADGAYAGQTAVAALVNLDDETDGDGDGVVDAAEGPALPNGGDANGDGVPDYLQGNVTTAYRNGSEPVTVAASAGCTLAAVQVLEEAAFPPDPDGTYPQGIVSFRAACTSATVSLLFHAAPALPPGYRKYGPIEPGNPATAQWFDYPAVVGRRGVGTQEVGQLRLRFVDGLLGDQSGPDGEIFDPGGPVAGPRILRDGFESGGLRTWAGGRGVI